MKKKWILFLAVISLLLLFSGCMSQNNGAQSSDTGSENQSQSESEHDCVMNETNFDLELFTVPVHSGLRGADAPRVIFLSDSHYYYFEGIGGYTSAERHDFMVEALIDEFNTENSFDAVVFLGDTVHNDHYLAELKKKYTETTGSADGFTPSATELTEKVTEWCDTYMVRLEDAGIPAFYVNASHDSLSSEDFYDVFGYRSNYVLLLGDIAYIICDTYAGERKNGFQTLPSDIPADFYAQCKELLDDSCVKEAYVACHYVNEGENLRALVSHTKVQGTLVGHSHYNEVTGFCGKPLIQTGHFSRANTVMLSWGLGFTPFVPIAENAPYVTDEEGNLHRDYSQTGSPWQWRVMEHTGSYTESYLVFPAVQYGAFAYDEHGRHNAFDAFYQPFVEARPAFLGEHSPIDRSYRVFWR